MTIIIARKYTIILTFTFLSFLLLEKVSKRMGLLGNPQAGPGQSGSLVLEMYILPTVAIAGAISRTKP